MPRIRRHHLPPQLLDHLLDRIRRRNISADQLGLMADWLHAKPEVPEGPWFKKFPGMTVCGDGNSSKPFCSPARLPPAKNCPDHPWPATAGVRPAKASQESHPQISQMTLITAGSAGILPAYWQPGP
jgi:hypothetical protein